ncbi:hypothetical protein GQX73_g10441 [Xylaria multiplex]|uniref:Uncharacterized protein n=1 Tax=Xylaria multiplex TaxID=323545 RepID=A0A7C8IGJ9_9PEZI|nr:hypothetical protein GQX73_g10441 [Xylaria multiplex]
MDAGDEIYRAARDCNERFDACVTDSALREHVVSLRSAQGDYNLWCSAIKATSRGKASLDYRLRNHQDVRDVVCGLLAGLATSLGRLAQRAAAILGDAELPENPIEEVPKSPSSTDSPVSWDAISDEWSNPGSAQAEDVPSMDPVMAECMSYINITLDQLARLSLAIRKAGNKYRFEKADAELKDNAFEEFRNHLASIILRAFPDPEAHGLSAEQKMKRVSDYGALTPVQKQLVHANILRKHRIEFTTRSRKRGERPVPGDIGLVDNPHQLSQTRALTSSSIAGSQNSSRVQDPTSRQSPVPGVSKAAPTPSVVLTMAPTATDVGSRLDVSRFMSAQTPSKVTNLTRVGSTQAYPNCPKLGIDGLLVCPYCDDVLPSSYARMEQSWKAHVAQDLMPYSCFIDGSSHQATGGSLTQARLDFWSADAWEDHVNKAHSDRIKVAQLPVLVELSKRSVIGPLSCPLCDFSTDAVDSKIDDHILQHLHEFSLRALPEIPNPVADDRSKASQISGSLSHVRDMGHADQRPLEYPVAKWSQFTTDLKWLRAYYPSFPLQELAPHIVNPAIGFANSAAAEFWGFHLPKVRNVLETIDPKTDGIYGMNNMESKESTDMTPEMITDIVDHTSTDIVDSLDWFKDSSRLYRGKDNLANLDLLPPQSNIQSTGREAIIEEIELNLFQQRSILYLDSSGQPKYQPRVILTGDSGVGKTVIAERLAYQIKEEKPDCSVLWVNASDMRSVSGAYSRIWKLAEKPDDVSSMETSLVYYLNWVFSGEWLMILDGIDRQTLQNMHLTGWLPSGLRGRLLLTTKDVSCLSLLGQATEIRVPPMDEVELPFPVIPALPPSRPEDFDVAIICLSHEQYKAIESLFTQFWEGDPRDFGKANEPPWDMDELAMYRAGHIYGCNAVLAFGHNTESITAEIRSSFTSIQLALLLDYCSGLPWGDNGSTRGVFRGDVVITNEVIRYNEPNLTSLAGFNVDVIPLNENVRPLLDIIGSEDGLERARKNTAYFLKQLQIKSSLDVGQYTYPGVAEDKLFMREYPHIHRSPVQCSCDDEHWMCSKALNSGCDDVGCDDLYLEPSLHYGRLVLTGGFRDIPAMREVISSPNSSIIALIVERSEVFESLPCIGVHGIVDYADFHNRSIWKSFANATAASTAKAILGEYSRLSPWMVPFNKNTHFIGREEILSRILSKIPPGTSGNSCQRTAIVGPKGVGKTQVALKAARLFRRQHPDFSVFWVSARSADELNHGFRGIGRRLRVSRISEDDLEQGENMISRVKLELGYPRAGNWLLIIDDIDDGITNVLADWNPFGSNGSILFICHHESLALRLGLTERDIIPVPTMNGEEATEMFRRYLPKTQLGSATDMVSVLDELRYSPLSIVQACDAIPASGMSVIQYLQHKLEKYKNTTTQPEKGKEGREVDQEGQVDQQKIKPQLGPTGETPTTVAPLSDEVEDKEEEGVWGYLVPNQEDRSKYPVAILRKRAVETEAGVEGVSPGNRDKQTTQSKPNSLAGFLIGRHHECDIVINQPHVSNRHCLLFPENRGEEVVALIEDLSSNGTFVNGEIIGRNNQRELKEYDEISILVTESFVFRAPAKGLRGNTFLKNYTILQRIGKGHFAEVFLCVEKSTGQRYAVKVFTMAEGVEDRSKAEGLQQEVALLLGISHPNIVNLKDSFNEKNTFYLVLDLAPEGELFNLIVKQQKLTESETRTIFMQLFQAVKYLHECNIIHRDIKPENIMLFDKDPKLKLMDFGLAKVVGDTDFTTTLCGTPSYVAPEILGEGKHRKYTKAVDIWSLGVVLYICLCGFPPFSDELYSKDFPYTLSQQIKSGRFDYPSPYWDSVGDPALDLIDSMLVVDPSKRFTIDQCMAHPWMTERISGALPTPSRRGSRAEGHGVPRRGAVRERTLLSTINNVDLDEAFRDFDQTSPLHKGKGVEIPESEIPVENEWFLK